MKIQPNFDFWQNEPNPHSPDDALSNRALHDDSDIGISTLFWIERGGDGKPGG
jgi:hypothetical protein